MRVRALVVLAAAAACTEVNEEISIEVVSDEDAAQVDSLVVTVYNPLVDAEEGGRPEFVGCSVGPFAPNRRLEIGADDPDAVAERSQQTFDFPLDEAFDLSFAPPAATDINPWGAVGVLIEARGRLQAELNDAVRSRSGTLLQGCYCVRTGTGRHPDPELDDAVRSACPPVGGREGEAKADRVIRLEPVSPPEFGLDACGRGTSPRAGAMVPGPTVCLRTRLCGDAPAGELCFDCEQPCDRLESLADAVVEFRTVDPVFSPDRQLVATNELGEARPSFESLGCTPGDTVSVDVRVFGRSATGLRVDVGCVEGASSPSVESEVGAAGRAFYGAFPDALVRGEVDGEDTRVSVLDGAALGVRDVLELRDRVVADVAAVESGDGRRFVAVVSRRADGSREVDVLSWDGSQLGFEVSDLLDGTGCPACTCGRLTPCTDAAECEGTEACVGGRCQDAACTGPNTLMREEEVRVQVVDVDDDGLSDIVVGSAESGGVTTYYGQTGTPFVRTTGRACECTRIAPFEAEYRILAFGGGPSRDLVVGTEGGPFVRYGTMVEGVGSRLTCGAASQLGEALQLAGLHAAPLRCPVDGPCLEFDDIVFGERRPRSDGALRWVAGAEAVLTGTRDLFRERSSLVLPGLSSGSFGSALAIQDGDLDGDGARDLAALYGFGDLRVWLGDGRGGFAETGEPVIESVDDLLEGEVSCGPRERLLAFDPDGDGRDELLLSCENAGRALVLGLPP
jgi:hypothetical protein